jgi:hypothetical protein
MASQEGLSFLELVNYVYLPCSNLGDSTLIKFYRNVTLLQSTPRPYIFFYIPEM